MNKPKDSAYLRLHTAIFLAGGTGIFGRLITLTEIPLVWYRLITAAIVMIIYLYTRGYRFRICGISSMQSSVLPTPSSDPNRIMPLDHLIKICGCGVLLAIHWVLFYGSIKAANVSIAVVCIALDGFFTAILDPLITRRRFSPREILLSLIGLVGIMLIFGFDSRYRLGIALGVISSFFYALFSIYSQRLQHSTGHKSSVMLTYELISGWIVLSAFLPFYAMMDPTFNLTPTIGDWIMLPVFGSLFTIGPFLLQLQALRSISAFTVNLSYNLEPIYSIIFALIMFDEGKELNRYFWIGVLLIILSVVLQTIYARRHRRTEEKKLNHEQ